MEKRFWGCFLAVFFASAWMPNLHGQENSRYRLAAAMPPDACVPEAGPRENTQEIPMPADGTCPEGTRTKYNHTYPWGMMADPGENFLWIGTASNNIGCRAMHEGWGNLPSDLQFIAGGRPKDIGYNWCAGRLGAPRAEGRAPSDWRPPKLMRYDLQSGELLDIEILAPELQDTTAFRAVGATEDRVFAAGPSWSNPDSVYVYQFDRYGHFLSVSRDERLKSIRKIVRGPDGRLYAAVLLPGRRGALAVLGKEGEMEILAEFPAPAAEIVFDGDKVFVGTWIGLGPQGFGGGEIWAGRLSDPASFHEIFSYADFDRNKTAGQVTSIGGMAVYEGKLFWGTMTRPPLTPAMALLSLHPQQLLGSYRRAMIFSAPLEGDGIGPYRVEYGRGGVHGRMGILDPGDAYTWSMAPFAGKLYVGALDIQWGALAPDFWLAYSLGLHLPPPHLPRLGADLYELSPSGEASALTLNGFGMPWLMGVRNLVPARGKLYAGATSAANLLSGWTLWEVNP